MIEKHFSKRKYHKIAIVVIIYLISIVFFIYATANRINSEAFNKTYEGVIYRINDDDYIEKTILQLDGELINPLLGKTRFKGKMIFREKEYELRLEVEEYADSFLADAFDGGANSNVGYLFADENLESITIAIYEYNDMYIKSWDSNGGMIFSAPSSSREEALEQSKRNMINSKYFKIYED